MRYYRRRRCGVADRGAAGGGRGVEGRARPRTHAPHRAATRSAAAGSAAQGEARRRHSPRARCGAVARSAPRAHRLYRSPAAGRSCHRPRTAPASASRARHFDAEAAAALSQAARDGGDGGGCGEGDGEVGRKVDGGGGGPGVLRRRPEGAAVLADRRAARPPEVDVEGVEGRAARRRVAVGGGGWPGGDADGHRGCGSQAGGEGGVRRGHAGVGRREGRAHAAGGPAQQRGRVLRQPDAGGVCARTCTVRLSCLPWSLTCRHSGVPRAPSDSRSPQAAQPRKATLCGASCLPRLLLWLRHF